jgi:hypothetical protein
MYSGCKNERLAQGLCNKHYIQYRKKGIIKKLPPAIPKECALNNCKQKVMARGLCDKHYQRLRKRGTVADPYRTPWPSECAFLGCSQQVSVKQFSLCWKHYQQRWNGTLGHAKEKESHGMQHSSEYHSWQHMKDRCFNKKHRSYRNYGGRGIAVCERWRNSFKAFYADLGDKPLPTLSIDRINNDGSYSCGKCGECNSNGWPLNVRWANDLTQRLNQRMRKTNKSGYKNVSWDKTRSLWTVRVKRNSRYVFGGRFDSLQEAVAARDNFLLKYEHGT